jgi:site-specific recombinase XerD
MWKGEFKIWLEDQGRSELTVSAYGRDVELYARWFEHQADQVFEPSYLTGRDLRAWREHSIHVERVSAATWNRRRASLRVFCSWALVATHVAADPFQGVEPVDIEEPPIRWLDDNEFNRVCRQLEHQINAARSDAWRRQAIRNRAMVALMMFAGLRDGEVVKVWREDLLLTDRTGAVRVRAGKGDKFTGEQGIPLHSEARIWLKAWVDVRGDVGGPLFGGKRTEQLTTRQVQRMTEELRGACGIDDLTPHDFRHTFVKRTLDGKYRRDGRPVPLSVVQKLARHARISQTARYAKPGQRDFEEAVGA